MRTAVLLIALTLLNGRASLGQDGYRGGWPPAPASYPEAPAWPPSDRIEAPRRLPLGDSDAPGAGFEPRRVLPRTEREFLPAAFDEPERRGAAEKPAAAVPNPSFVAAPNPTPGRLPNDLKSRPAEAKPAAAAGETTPLIFHKGADSPKGTDETADKSGMHSLVTVGSSMAVVLGLFLVLAWVFRRASPGGNGLLPRDVLEVLGRAPLAGRQQVHLLRLGTKLVLVSMHEKGIETLSEVTDPEEVARLTALCQGAAGPSPVFGELLRQVSKRREGA